VRALSQFDRADVAKQDATPAPQTQLNDIARRLNGRPCKTLGWKTPDETLTEETASYSKHVALDP
jgi:IS30 family transposase